MATPVFGEDDPALTAIRELFGAAAVPARIACGGNREYSLVVSEPEFALAIPYLAARKFVLISLFCVEGLYSESGHSLQYIFERKGSLLILIRNITADRATSIATIFPSASWPERECRDGFGIGFEGAFDTRRLVLHETYPAGFRPLKKSFSNAPITTVQNISIADEYPFRKVSGEGVYQVPVGPVHARHHRTRTLPVQRYRGNHF